jgi:predicted nucleotidyltransferase
MAHTQATTGINDALIEEIVRRVLSVAKPEKVILFGSAATGKMTRDSDIDLLVVERNPGDRRGKVFASMKRSVDWDTRSTSSSSHGIGSR